MGNFKIETYVVGIVRTKCYIVINEETNECIVIDPGASGGALTDKIRTGGYQPVAVFLTHGHFDHVAAARTVAEEFQIPIYAYEAERETLEHPQKNASVMIGAGESYNADVFVTDGQVLDLAGFSVTVIHTPGHTEGGCCYYFAEEEILFSGDTLFAQSVGRTDLPGGSMSTLVRSVREKLLVLSTSAKDITVYPGHNDPTTIETERKYNPYL